MKKSPLFLFMIFFVLLPPLSLAGEGALSTRALLERSGVKLQLEQMPAAMEKQLEMMERQNGPMPPDRRAALVEAARKALEPGKLLEELAARVEKSIGPKDRAAIMKFLDSPLGRKVIAAENAMASPDAMETLEKEGPVLVEALMKDPTRLALIQSLDKATGATELATDLSLATGLALEWALISQSDMPGKPGFEQLQAFYAKNRPVAKMQMAQMMLAGYALGYRDLTNEELTGYLSFANSEVGKRYFHGTGKAIGAVLTGAASEMGTLLAESEKSPV